MAKVGRACYSRTLAAQRAAMEVESNVGFSCDAVRRHEPRASSRGCDRQLLAFGDGTFLGGTSDRGSRLFVRDFGVDVRVTSESGASICRSVNRFASLCVSLANANRA